MVWELKGEVIDLVVTIVWLVWYARNSIVYDEVPWNTGGIINKAEGLLTKFRAINLPSLYASDSHLVKWEVPLDGSFKVKL